ncbi:hypothetical protein [Kineosporia babensis]|uniref:Uncharacterized protein n=1 Tax=Kineosporia babensis TaxID=499548 RepID=A0A9X1SYH0_9ACTN|nr:hypothetical protein [Kineosporia babensis]MCD5316914.1 hypothetical protein [Kineosporia babensis]
MDAVRPSFLKQVQNFGAEPAFYQDGTLTYENSRTSRWTNNSTATVRDVDICVFVVLEKYGEITWNTELDQALESGHPFIIMVLESSLAKYTAFVHGLTDLSALKSPDDRKLVEMLQMIRSDYELTVVPFSHDSFGLVLGMQLSKLFQRSVRLLRRCDRRTALLRSLDSSGQLNRRQIDQLIEIATNDYEVDKLQRKMALRRLAAADVRDRDLLLDVCTSKEQGVQRLGFDLLDKLIPLPPDEDLVRRLADISAQSDDVGVPRRFLSSIADLEPQLLDVALSAAGPRDEGSRRRAFEGLENNEQVMREAWGHNRLREFLDLCEGKTPDQRRWIDRLRAMREELDRPDEPA